MSKHTPGPWTVEKLVDEFAIYDDGRNDSFAPAVTYVNFDDDIDMAEANARLIAAAPDMLDILQAFADLDVCGDQRDRLAAFDARHGIKPGNGRYAYLYGRVSAVLAKAKGE